MKTPSIETLQAGRIATGDAQLKAARYNGYGSADFVHIVDVDKPVPKDDEVLLKVRAASVNPLDSHLLYAPLPLRIFTGLREPKDPRPGTDVAGEVEAVGARVTRFKRGDRLFGFCRGAFAECACASELKVAAIPQNVTFEQAASLPVAALTALQALRDKGNVQSGQKVLINGASGGVGTFAVQIARSFGAEVTAVCSARNAELVRSIGAGHVIDYARVDFTKLSERYDVLLDCVANHSLLAYRRVLNPGGKYIAIGMLGSGLAGFLARAAVAPILSHFVNQQFSAFIAKGNSNDLAALVELLISGKIRPIIGRRYTLSELPTALQHIASNHVAGKLVITVHSES